MITWLQQHIIKHQKWLFGSLLVVTIVAFVLMGNTTGGLRSGPSRTLFGKVLTDEVLRDMSLGGEVAPAFDLLSPRDPALRLTALHLADELGIGDATEKDMEDLVLNAFFLKGVNGQIDPSKYQKFLDERIGEGKGKLMTKAEFSRLLNDTVRIRRVREVLASAKVLPEEALAGVIEAKTEWSVEIASLPYAVFKGREGDIAVDEAAVKAYFEARKSLYAEPEKIQAYAVNFALDTASTYEPKVDEREIKAYFDKHGTEFQTPGAKPGDAPVAAVFENVKDLVKAAAIKAKRQEQLDGDAANLASDTINELKKAYGAFDEPRVKVRRERIAEILKGKMDAASFPGADKDNDGKISVQEIFPGADKDNDGKISPQEIEGIALGFAPLAGLTESPKAFVDSAEFKALIGKKKCTLVAIPPYVAGKPVAPAELLGSELQRVGGSLGREEPIATEPMRTTNGYAALVYSSTVPVRAVALDEPAVKARVVADWKESVYRDRHIAKLKASRDVIVAARIVGKSFADAARAAGFDVRSVNRFNCGVPSDEATRLSLVRGGRIDSGIASLKVGEVSPVLGDRIIALVDKKVPDINVKDPSVEDARKSIQRDREAMVFGIMLWEVLQGELPQPPAAPEA